MSQPTFIYNYIIPSLLISPILSISMNSWFLIWMTLEFNLMTFIPLIIFFNNYYKNTSMKYFIIQAFSSSILILCSNCLLINNWNLNSIIIILMNMSILIKIGAAPFHSWFINMMNNLNWLNCLILATWQKIIPMIILMYMYNYKILYTSAILSSMIGALMGLNHQSIRLILSYSSINHIGWMLINLMISETLWNLYFLSYLLINFSIMLIFNKFNIYFINQLFMLNNMKSNKIILLLNFLSISGLPPFFGFMMKWFSIHMMNYNNNYYIIMIFIMMSILTFSFYMQICLIILIQYNLNYKLFLNNKNILNNFKFNSFIYINSFLNMWIISLWMI